MNKLDIKTERYIINKFISMPKLFDSLGIDYRIDANIFCPFHHNENTPSAHLYHDENGYRLWCFSESKMYGAWNVYKEYLKHINTNQLATIIFNKLSSSDQEAILEELNNEEELDTLPYQKNLLEFKRHTINITQLLQDIADSYQDA